MTIENINDLKNAIDVGIIKPYLASMGYYFSENDDCTFAIARKDNLRFIAFAITSYKHNSFNTCNIKNTDMGQIVFDTDGNVLLFDKAGSSYCSLGFHKKENYIDLDPDKVFVDDMILLQSLNDDHSRYLSVYKFDGSKYVEAYKVDHVFIEKTTDNKAVINDGGRLFDIKKQMYLNDIQFSDILDYDDINSSNNLLRLPFLFIQEGLQLSIMECIKNNKLLFAYKNIENNQYLSYPKKATVFMFVDTFGNIVSKAYFKSKFDYLEKEVTNDTYVEVLQSFVDKLNEDAKNDYDEKNALNEAKRVKEESLEENSKALLLKALSDSIK